jgi:hypothetical protein
MAERSIPVPMDQQGAPSPENANPQGYQPTDDEKKAIKLAHRLFEKARAGRKPHDGQWLDYYKMFRGKQWKEQRPTYRHSEVINMIFQTIQSQVPILTDSRPRIEYIPQEPGDTEVSEILNQVAESDWQKANWLQILTEGLYDGHIYGTALYGVEFNPDAEFGLGAIDFKTRDPFYYFPDPAALDCNKRAKYEVIAEPVDIDTLKTEYPKLAKFLKADLIDLMQGDKTDLDKVHFKSPVDNRTIVDGTSQYDLKSKDQALKIVVRLKSDEYIEEQSKETDPETGEEQTVFEQKLKYPNGRKIVVASGVLLEDGPIEYDDGLFPTARLVNYLLPREFWGESEVAQLMGPQKVFNKLISFALDVYTLMGNPIWVVGTGAGVDTDNLVNRPGLVVECDDAQQVKREAGVEISPVLLSLVDRMRVWFNETSGMSDLSRGAEPKGVTAASAIQSLQEAAQTRLRLKSRHIDAALQDAGKLYKNRVFQFYSAPRVFRLTNNQAATKYFKFHVETEMNENGDPITDQAGNPKRAAHYQSYEPHPETGQLMPHPDIRKLQIMGDFDVRVSTGSSLPFAKAEKFDQSVKLFEMGVIDDEELMKNADYPNWEAVLQRVNQKKQAAAAAQAQSAQAQGAQKAQAKAAGGPPAA